MSKELSKITRITTSELFDLRRQIEMLVERSRDTNQAKVRDNLQRLLESIDKAIEGVAFHEASLAWRSKQEVGKLP